jgi:hypothetical protein
VDSCDECGFVYESIGRDQVAQRFRGFGRRFADRLSGKSELLHRRPEPGVWSAVEYGCHVRDVFLINRERLYLALAADTPDLAPMFREQRVGFARYNTESASQLVEELTVVTRLVADAFAALTPSQWSRSCIYNFPDASERSVLWLGQHTIHEGEHHLMDIDRCLATASQT